MATALSASTAVERPLAGALFDHAESTPDVAAVFLPQESAVREITWREIADDVTRMSALLARRVLARFSRRRFEAYPDLAGELGAWF